MRQINRVILHCSDTENFVNVDPKVIDGWHKDRGFKDPLTGIHLGYHWVVQPSGECNPGRPESSVGAHVEGHNADSIGVCVIGRGKTTLPQLHILVDLSLHLMKSYDLKPENFYGHSNFTTLKTCPNFDIEMFRALLRACSTNPSYASVIFKSPSPTKMLTPS